MGQLLTAWARRRNTPASGWGAAYAARSGWRCAAAALLRFVGGPLLALFSSIWDDLTAPARRFASGVRHMRDAARAEAQAGGSGKRAGFAYFKNGVHAYRHLIGGALRYLMPAAALCVLVFTVQEVLGSSFSLGVSYSGDFLVFIENEGVWDSAEKMVQERVMASEGAKVEWDEHPVFELRIVDPAGFASWTPPPAPAPATWWTRSSRHPQTRS